ncbi:P-loop containing nucleoside triphosphate hydrolase protein [Mycena latifolia]|nr:P-loop containing nucleoside triphosphate hydrolase protein [Mycena latifolia]
MVSSAILTTTYLLTLRIFFEDWDQKRPVAKGFPMTLGELHQTLPSRDASKDVILAFRTRPPLLNETAEKIHAYPDATDGEAQAALAEPGIFVTHVPGMKEVYQRTMLALALSGGVCCILAYGQTGSGNIQIYTMENLEHRRLLVAQEGENANAEPGDIFEFSVAFLELLGRHALDLLEPSAEVDAENNPIRTEMLIREDKVGNIRLNLVSSSVRSSAELEELINLALSHRRTTATLRNAASSRSHVLLTITIKNTLLPYADEGQLILVDLAGSERYEDSKDHNKQRMEKARDNTKSLVNLKECVRAKAKMAVEDGFVHIPWRANKLTMLLKMMRFTRTSVLVHSLRYFFDIPSGTNTLSYAAPFKTVPPKPRGPSPYDARDPRTWDRDKTIEWLTAQFTERAMKSRQARWNVEAKAAHFAGKTPAPLESPPPGQLDLGVDISKICPAASTAKNLGMLYTPQFAESWTLFYLILTAETRKRNEIMNSRKQLVLEDAYRLFFCADGNIFYGNINPKQKKELTAVLTCSVGRSRLGNDNHDLQEVQGRRQGLGGDVYPKTFDDLMDRFRAHKAAASREQ